jgi:hypothetical protein
LSLDREQLDLVRSRSSQRSGGAASRQTEHCPRIPNVQNDLELGDNVLSRYLDRTVTYKIAGRYDMADRKKKPTTGKTCTLIRKEPTSDQQSKRAPSYCQQRIYSHANRMNLYARSLRIPLSRFLTKDDIPVHDERNMNNLMSSHLSPAC